MTTGNPKKTKHGPVSKGVPSGFVVSLAIHAAAFLLAGALVVFTVQQKEEKKFAPPKPIERPKMKLKKPKVKVRKNARPKSASRIVTKVKKADMPDIQLPELSTMGDGFSGGTGAGGFDLMPNIDELTLLGSGQSIGNDFEGTFYDFKRDRSGRNLPVSAESIHPILSQFMRSGWKKSKLARYYQSPRKIYATTFMVPPTRANLAPEIFKEDTEGWGWGILFTGELVHSEDIKFRFWGNGLQMMAVRVDGEIVLLSYFEKDNREGAAVHYADLWQSSSPDNRKYPIGLFKGHVGDWIELKANEPKKMEVLYGIAGGGIFNAMLLVEVEGEEYPKSPYMGGPILPLFKTEPLSLDQREVIGTALYPGFGCMTNGPVFRDYGVNASDSTAENTSQNGKDEVPESKPLPLEKNRVWTTVEGEEFEAEYIITMGDKIWMKSPKGKKYKIPITTMSTNDLYLIELMEPPELHIEFSKRSWFRREMPNQTEVDTTRPMRRHDYVFGAKVKQKEIKPYDHPLTIEYFAVGEEVDGDNYILFDRQKSTFTPSLENNLSHEFYGEEVDVMSWAMSADRPVHGTKYGGFMITITNERGEMIQHKVTHDFLLEYIENLKEVPIGKHFDKMGNRVAPPRPTKKDVYVDSY